ncbi:nucleotide sugar dehydrogenase [Pedobacter sp. HMWF019]|uniref:nucleotide sugar dehydrogenase n=1 Tax=Pedobacter sp. HMWF019 TaxID=2056856 RepID=UPI000D38D55E|nr:nucleotide sugar dehydrogenase [Pedobacter sp. HMWF019]PTT02322.1 nucleotide sugar dehydrogenase [Pedobacter sp. HMWF019]
MLNQPLVSALDRTKIAVIGLGYVGLPLSVILAEKYRVVGFDINSTRVQELSNGNDVTLEVSSDALQQVLMSSMGSLDRALSGLYPSGQQEDMANCNVFIITVPTPTDKHDRPVLTPLVKASEMVGAVLKKGDIVIYESTVYPGVTEDECVPVLEKTSGLIFNNEFFVGYSPERINPGDKLRTVANILKVTSGSTPKTADFVDLLYKSVIKAGTFKASSIRVAEASKVIENSQRDINIAFVNELAMMFNLMGIDTAEVLEAAGTKWNFLPFKPGLVGGHCIGVDPYYLAQKSQEVGYHPEIILAGRRINNGMSKHIAAEVLKQMMRKDLKVLNAKVLLLGFTFKENCPDVRNTKVADIFKELRVFDVQVEVYDPWADPIEVEHNYGIRICSEQPDMDQYAAIILAVAHDEFKDLNLVKRPSRVIYDVKGILDKNLIDARL